jgi:hypothetical protein
MCKVVAAIDTQRRRNSNDANDSENTCIVVFAFLVSS